MEITFLLKSLPKNNIIWAYVHTRNGTIVHVLSSHPRRYFSQRLSFANQSSFPCFEDMINVAELKARSLIHWARPCYNLSY